MELRTIKPNKQQAETTRKREELEAENFSRKNSSPESSNKKIEEIKAAPEKENIHKNHRQRLKEQYLNHGFSSLSDVQKLELLLFYSIPQKDTNPLAHKLLSNYGSIKNILYADPNDLAKLDGIKDNSAILIKLINDFSNFVNLPDTSLSFIGSTSDARSFCTKLYNNIDVEQFYVICLSKSNRVKKFAMIKSGIMDEVNVPIREITRLAIEQKCTRIIICHNHPFGNCNASNEDINFTFSLMCSCLLNNIEILDHIIVGTNGSSSFSDCGLMDRILNKANNVIVIPKETKISISESKKTYIISNPTELTEL